MGGSIWSNKRQRKLMMMTNQSNILNPSKTKRDMLKLVEDPDVSFVAHENLYFTLSKNTIHPKNNSSSILAGNLDRHIHNLFWQKPRRVARRVLLQPYNTSTAVQSSFWLAKQKATMAAMAVTVYVWTSFEATALYQLLDMQAYWIAAEY